MAQHPALRLAHAAMALLFLFAALLQYNDPDPLVWAAMYTAPALVCVAAAVRRVPWSVPASVGAVALVFAGVWAPKVLGQVPWREMVTDFGMTVEGVEEARETLGLLIVAAWMALTALVSRSSTAARVRPQPSA